MRIIQNKMENNGSSDGADRTREEASEVPLIVNDHNVIDDSPDTNNSQLSQFQQQNNSTNTPPEVSLDLTEFLLFHPRLGPNSLAVIEDDAPNDSRETDFSGDGSTRNIINTETKDVEEKVTEGDANELETQIDSESVKENEIGTNTVTLLDSHLMQFILQPCTPSENPQNLQSSVNRRHSDSKVPTYRNWSPGNPRPSTSSPNSMPRHNLFHSVTTNRNSRSAQDKPYPCDLCDKSYTRKYDLTQHIFTHTGNMPYPCKLCDKSFARKYDHTRHMRTHTENKPYTCPECDQGFNSLDDMNIHRRIHTGEKPFKCRLCDYAAYRKNGLTRHMKTHCTDRVLGSSSSSSRAISAEPVRQEQPEAAQARVELAGNETILPRDQIAPQEDQDERSRPSANRLNLQGSVNRRHSDSKVPTRNWSPGNPRPSTSSPNSMPHHNSFESGTTNNSNSRNAQDKPYPCNLCNKSYSHKNVRNRHMLKCTGNKPKNECPECGQKFITFEEMINHRLIHTVQKPSKCQLCEYATHRIDWLSNHMKTHSTDRVSGSSSTSSGAIPAEPVHQEQPEAAQARVELAGNETISPRDQIAPQVDQHEMSQPDHDGEPIEPSNSESAQDGTFPCDLCHKSFTRKQDRKRHKLKCIGKKPYPCDLCNNSYPYERNLKRHMRTHTEKKPYTCPECGQGFNRSDVMNAHRRIHTEKKLCTCRECGQQFSTFKEMMDHRRIHTVQKPYKCQLCEYATHRQDGLSSHMKTHSTDRVPSSSSEARPTRPGSSRASPATRPASNHSNEQQLRDQIPAEPVRQEQPEAAQARVELAGNETISPRDQIAPQEDQDEMSQPDHDGEPIEPRYQPNL